jgi:guanylate kinase
VVRRRLAVAAGEIAQASLFTYNIVNDTLESAYAQLRRVYLEHSGACAADRT